MTAAAAAAGVSVRCARKWVGRYRAAGEAGLVDRSSRPLRVANRTAVERVQADREVARLADDSGGDRRDACDATLDRVGDPDPASGWAGGAGSALNNPSATSAQGQASSCTSTSRSSDGSKAARANVAATVSALQRQAHDAAAIRLNVAGSTSTSRSTTIAPRLRRSPPDESAATALDFLRRAVAFYRRHGIQVEQLLTDNGAAYIAIIHASPAAPRLQHLRTRPPATDKRKNRALHPHDARRLGLRRHLRLKPRTHRRP